MASRARGVARKAIARRAVNSHLKLVRRHVARAGAMSTPLRRDHRDLKELRALPLHRPADDASPAPSAGARRDGRATEELRPLAIRLGVIAGAAGSCWLELGHTQVVCSVLGPHQTEGKQYLTNGQLDCSLKHTSFAKRQRGSRSAAASTAERGLSSAMAAALSSSVQLQQYPKSVISVHALVLQDDGGALAAAITCASLALADASVLLYGLVSACSCVTLGETAALDCDASDAAAGSALMTVACLPALDQLTLLRQEGRSEFGLVTKAMQLAIDGTRLLHGRMQEAVAKRKEAVGAPAADAAPVPPAKRPLPDDDEAMEDA